MTDSKRKVVRFVFALITAFFVLPELIVCGYLFSSWFRTRVSDAYYVEFPYLGLAVALLLLSTFGLVALFYAARGRSFYGLAFVAPIFMGICTLVVVPNAIPRGRSMTADSNFVSTLHRNLQLWCKSHQRFPQNQAELGEALRLGSPSWDPDRRLASGDSFYAQKGHRLPYQLVVEPNAVGPRIDNVSKRPAVLYYSVTNDYQRFWLTYTALPEDVAAEATVRKTIFNNEPVVFTADARDSW